MIEGDNFLAIGCYLQIERSESGIKRIFFSEETPLRHSELAEQIIRHIVDGAPPPALDLDLTDLTEFQRKVISVVRIIPRGAAMTYGDVAALAGSPGAGRAVGKVMASNPFALAVPCHRVVAKRGLGGYFWGLDVKRKLLEIEMKIIPGEIISESEGDTNSRAADYGSHHICNRSAERRGLA